MSKVFDSKTDFAQGSVFTMSRAEHKAITLDALQAGAKVIQKNTVDNLIRKHGARANSADAKWGQALVKGVKIKKNPTYDDVSVSVRGDARTIWFELGTKERVLKRSKTSEGASRGFIRAEGNLTEASQRIDEAMKAVEESYLKKINGN